MKKENTSIRLKKLMDERDIRQIDILNMCIPYCKKYDVKMNKSDISQYVSGKVEPNQDKLAVLGMALNVNETWLMGYDVPMERKTSTITFDTTTDDKPYNRAINKLGKGIAPTEDEMKAFREEFPKALNRVPKIFTKFANDLENTYKNMLISYFDVLNTSGKAEALKRIEELTYIPKYTNEDQAHPILNAAHAIEGATDEDKQHDDDLMDNDEFWK